MPRMTSPYNYPGAHQDLVRSLNDADVAGYNLAASKEDANYGVQQQQQAQNLVLGGLNQQFQGQQQQRDLSNNRLGILSSLLASVYK